MSNGFVFCNVIFADGILLSDVMRFEFLKEKALRLPHARVFLDPQIGTSRSWAQKESSQPFTGNYHTHKDTNDYDVTTAGFDV